MSAVPVDGRTRRKLSGQVLLVDDIGRELTLLVEDEPLRVDVPPSCPIVLNGEPVRLRLLQPADEVCVEVEGDARPTARQVRVRGPQLRG
jgi:hypothetical protein